MSRSVATLNENRQTLMADLSTIKGVGELLGGNQANFILCQIVDEEGRPSNKRAMMVYKTMAEHKGVVVRFRGTERGCEGCLRITVGTKEECKQAVKHIAALLQ